MIHLLCLPRSFLGKSFRKGGKLCKAFEPFAARAVAYDLGRSRFLPGRLDEGSRAGEHVAMDGSHRQTASDLFLAVISVAISRALDRPAKLAVRAWQQVLGEFQTRESIACEIGSVTKG